MSDSADHDLCPPFNVEEVFRALRQGDRILREKIAIQRDLLLLLEDTGTSPVSAADLLTALARMEDVLTAQQALQEGLLSVAATYLGAMAQELGLRAIGDATDLGLTREAFMEARRIQGESAEGYEALEENLPGLSRSLYAQDLAETSLGFVGDIGYDPSGYQDVLVEAWKKMPLDGDHMIEEEAPHGFFLNRLN